MTKESRKLILRAITMGLIVNLLLASLKLTFGYLGNAQALFSDGLNSFSDIFVSLLILVFMSVATKKPDHDHPYGHEKFEGLAYFALGLIFSLVAIYIFYQSIFSLVHYFTNGDSIEQPQLFTVVISLFALLVKLFLYTFFKKVSKTYDSPTLRADAKNHLIDAWATLASLIGLSIAQFGLIYFDYLASFIIGIFIFRLAIQILKDSISYLVDQAPSVEEIHEIHDFIMTVKGVIQVDELKVRKHMTQRYVDVEIAVLGDLSLEKAHKIAESVHHQVEKRFPDVLHCMVHVNPHHP